MTRRFSLRYLKAILLHVHVGSSGRYDVHFSAAVIMVERLGADAFVPFELEAGREGFPDPLPDEL